jgi:hypothetical protein
MAKQDAGVEVTNTFVGRGIIPFTSGLIMFVYAFFWPEGYGHWLGSIVRAFRATAGF